MEQEYLIDTNAVIDYLDDKLPEAGSDLMDGITAQISVITCVKPLKSNGQMPSSPLLRLSTTSHCLQGTCKILKTLTD